MSGAFSFMGQRQISFGGVVAWIGLIGIVVVTAIALISRYWGWPLYLELLSHFQRQYWWISGLALGAIGLTRRRWPLLLGLACVTALTVNLLTWYLPPHFLTTGAPGNCRILIANVNSKNRDFEAVLQWTQQVNPDLALFMEVDNLWLEQLDELAVELPYFVGEGNEQNNFGIVLYSRYPFTEAELVNFAADSMPSIVATTAVNEQSLAIVGTHPLPPVSPQYFQSRNRQLQQLGQFVQALAQPTVVIGDFNITMWSPYYRRLQQQTGLKNVRDGFGILPSWPSGPSFPLPNWLAKSLAIPIDHGLVSPALTVTQVYVGPDVGSDHLPVVVELRL